MADRYRVWGEGKPEAVFLAANGFPVGSYDFLLASLARRLPLAGLDSRGAWPEIGPPEPGFDWRDHARDLLSFLHSGAVTDPVIGLGHSIGATVSALAAAERPQHFRALVLIDPATIPGRWLPWLVKLVPGITQRMPLVARTRSRREVWPSRAAFRDYHASKPVFHQFSEVALADYAAAGLQQCEDGYRLSYDRIWEAWNFQHTALFWPVVRRLPMPVLILRGEHSYLHPAREFARQCRRLPPHIRALTVPDTGHMLPQEAPGRVLDLINEWLDETV